MYRARLRGAILTDSTDSATSSSSRVSAERLEVRMMRRLPAADEGTEAGAGLGRAAAGAAASLALLRRGEEVSREFENARTSRRKRTS